MSYKKNEDELGQRQPRDAKGRFARIKKPIKIKPLPKVDEPFKAKEKWGSYDDFNEDTVTCGTLTHFNYEFKDLQKIMSPKKDCKAAYEKAHTLLIASGGAIARVINKKTNKPFGFLVRIPSTTDPNVVFLRFTKIDPTINNTYFQKLNAVVSTVINGERWLAKRKERGYAIEDIPFEYFFQKAHRFMAIDGGVTVVQPLEDTYYVAGRTLNGVEREGYILDVDMMDYINRFENKAREYYKNNKKNKYFVALPFN